MLWFKKTACLCSLWQHTCRSKWSFFQSNASNSKCLLHRDQTWSNGSILSSIMKPESTCVVGRLLYYDRMSRVYCNNCLFIQLPCIDNHDSDFCYIVIIYTSSITAHYPLHGLMSWTTIIIQSLGWLLAGGPMVAQFSFIDSTINRKQD